MEKLKFREVSQHHAFDAVSRTFEELLNKTFFRRSARNCAQDYRLGASKDPEKAVKSAETFIWLLDEKGYKIVKKD
jgi:hypothetical protein